MPSEPFFNAVVRLAIPTTVPAPTRVKPLSAKGTIQFDQAENLEAELASESGRPDSGTDPQ